MGESKRWASGKLSGRRIPCFLIRPDNGYLSISIISETFRQCRRVSSSSAPLLFSTAVFAGGSPPLVSIPFSPAFATHSSDFGRVLILNGVSMADTRGWKLRPHPNVNYWCTMHDVAKIRWIQTVTSEVEEGFSPMSSLAPALSIQQIDENFRQLHF
jgi:hypothetical protein